MATFTERLALVIDADGKGAIKAIEGVGNAAQRELGKTEDRLERTSKKMVAMGTVALTAGAVAATGLYKAAQSAQDLADSQDKANVVFGEGNRALEEFARGAATNLGKSKASALDVAATFGQLGKNVGLQGKALEDFGTQLATRTADIAEAYKKDFETVEAAIQGGLRGRGKALLELGVVINDQTVKNEAYRSGIARVGEELSAGQKTQAAYKLIMEQTSEVAGTFANSQGDIGVTADQAKARLEDLKASIGAGALPVIDKLATVAGGLVDKFNGLPEPVKNVVSTLGTVVTGAALVGGALSIVGGKLLTARDAFTKLDDAGNRSMNNLGRGAAAVGKVFAAWGLTEAIFGVVNELQGLDSKGSEAMDRFTVATQGSVTDVVDAFNELSRIEDDTLKISHVWEDWGTSLRLAGRGAERSIEDIQAAFDKLFKSSPDKAKALVDAVRAQNEALDHSSSDYKETAKLVELWSQRVGLSAEAQKVATAATEGTTEALDDQAEVVYEAGAAWKDYADKLKAMVDPVFGAIDASNDLAEAQRDVAEKLLDYKAAVDEHGKGSEAAKSALRDFNKAQYDQVRAAADSEAALAGLREAFEAGKTSIDQVRSKLQEWVGQGKITQIQADAITFAMGAMKTQADKLDGTSITLTFATKGLANVQNVLDTVNRGVSAAGNALAVGRKPPARAHGGPVEAGAPYIIGEQGPEVFVPTGSGYVVPNGKFSATGGITTAPIIVNIQGPVSNEADARRWVLAAVSEAQRLGETRLVA